MDSGVLADMLAHIENERLAIDGVVVVRNGYVVLEAYNYPFEAGRQHIIYSCTKSVISALVGIAIGQGIIQSVDVPVLSFFPERTVANVDVRKRAMSLEDLLTMTTGLNCRDSYLYRWQGLREMERSDDWVQFVLDLPMAHQPGTHFEYCNGASFLLSAIIQEKTGKTARAYAEEYLFGPLGIDHISWAPNPQGITIGWSELYMEPIDMAKIGYLYLNDGQWDGAQVVPAEWVAASTHKQIAATLEDGYGYQWWVDDDGYYMALGYSGQFVFVVPDLDLLAVFVSDLAEQDFYTPQHLLDEYVIPSAEAAQPLPDNPEGVTRLQAQIEALAGY